MKSDDGAMRVRTKDCYLCNDAKQVLYRCRYDDLKDWECDTLFDSQIETDYAGIGDDWNPRFLSVTWSDADQEPVEEAISNHLEAAPAQADVDEYKRLKAELAL